MCYAKNEWGTATSNSVFVRAAILNNFKEQPPITKTVEEGKPFRLPCEAPDGWPKPNIYWMIQVRFANNPNILSWVTSAKYLASFSASFPRDKKLTAGSVQIAVIGFVAWVCAGLHDMHCCGHSAPL